MSAGLRPAASPRETLRALGIDDLVLEIHDPAFPAAPGEDVGRGAPASRGALDFLEFARDLGFTGIQLGPQGETSPGNPSPYDGSVLARSTLSIDLAEFASGEAPFGRLLGEEEWQAVVRARPEGSERRVAHRAVHAAHRRALDLAFARWGRGDAHEFGQLVARWQHDRFRRHAAALGLALYGDFQVGVPPCEAEACPEAFLPDHRLGAPPSRTNPEGQAWNYPVLDPRRPEAMAFFAARVARTVADYDALRIDHPHGLVDPWVYRPGAGDPLEAVRAGARLFGTPEDPGLAPFAIARPEQIDRAVPRHADLRILDLDDAQVERHAVWFDVLARTGIPLVCEVLSTQPYPLARVLERHGLGRCRVVQKADPRNEADVYRSENAAPADWVQIGNHDTPTIWGLLDRWRADGSFEPRAAYLARRLGRSPARTAAELAQATFADLFLGPARHVLVSFNDLLGYPEPYNVPGTFDDRNWSLRVGPDYRREHAGRVGRGEALDVAGALATALYRST